jgi:hypothetical protein
MGQIMSHDHPAADMPAIPFSEADLEAMYQEDKRAAWDIARLTGGIFTFGLILYSLVLLWMINAEPHFSVR